MDGTVNERTDARTDFWERPEVVDEFAARAADHRLARLVESMAHPQQVRVLDIGCAGGRNTEFLAARGFDVYAVDTSRAMVGRTRARLAPITGEAEAHRRVIKGHMRDLGRFADDDFHLVLALGVYHNAQSSEEFETTLAETARVLKPGGRVLVSIFSPDSEPKGEPLALLSPSGNLYLGFDSGPLYLLKPEALDTVMNGHGLHPDEPTAGARAATDAGFRISVNGLYVKRS